MSEQSNWEKQALENLLNENIKDRRGDRRWRTIWRVIWLGLILFGLYTFFNPFKNAIKELLGHSSLAATQVYTHNSIQQLKEVYKKHPRK
jgi:integrase